jgi:hypothetical protein
MRKVLLIEDDEELAEEIAAGLADQGFEVEWAPNGADDLFVSCLAGMPFRGLDAPGAFVALLFGMAAMDAQSALVHLMMRSVDSTNVMTTNTTLLAISSAKMLLGWIKRNRANPSETSNADYVQAGGEIAALLPLWLGFLVLGAIAYITVGLSVFGHPSRWRLSALVYAVSGRQRQAPGEDTHACHSCSSEHKSCSGS